MLVRARVEVEIPRAAASPPNAEIYLLLFVQHSVRPWTSKKIPRSPATTPREINSRDPGQLVCIRAISSDSFFTEEFKARDDAVGFST